MTHETLAHRSRRYLFGFGAAALMLAAGAFVTVDPIGAPLVQVPVSQWLGLTVTQTARDAYVNAMLKSGWELTAPMKVDGVDPT